MGAGARNRAGLAHRRSGRADAADDHRRGQRGVHLCRWLPRGPPRAEAAVRAADAVHAGDDRLRDRGQPVHALPVLGGHQRPVVPARGLRARTGGHHHELADEWRQALRRPTDEIVTWPKWAFGSFRAPGAGVATTPTEPTNPLRVFNGMQAFQNEGERISTRPCGGGRSNCPADPIYHLAEVHGRQLPSSEISAASTQRQPANCWSSVVEVWCETA